MISCFRKLAGLDDFNSKSGRSGRYARPLTLFALVMLAMNFSATHQALAGLIFDNSASIGSQNINFASGYGLGTNITAASDVAISSFSVQTKFLGGATANFFIADHITHKILYDSGALSFGPESDYSFKASPILSFSLLAGGSYDIGLVATTADFSFAYAAGNSSFTQNGLTSTTDGTIYSRNPTNYLTTSRSDGYLRISGVQSVPEPASVFLLGSGFLGILGYIRQNMRAADRI